MAKGIRIRHGADPGLGIELPEPKRTRKKQPPLAKIRGARAAGKAEGEQRQYQQRSTVKVSYTKNNPKKSWAAHGKYLAREGAQREGDVGKGFDSTRDDIDIAKEAGAWQWAGDRHMFRVIVSPENAEHMDLKQHAKDLVQQMEKDLKTRLQWIAIDHYNTAHPHVHILIRGKDELGQDLVMDRDYISQGIRNRSAELATTELGYRQEHEVIAARGRLVRQLVFTEIDRALMRRAEAGTVTYSVAVPGSPGRAARELQEIRRLAFLETVGLASKTGSMSWKLSPDLEKTLREHQDRRNIIKTRAKEERESAYIYMNPGSQLRGRVTEVGNPKHPEHYKHLVIQGTDGHSYYLQETPAVRQVGGEKGFQVGQQVELTGKRLTKNGRQIPYMEVRIVAEQERTLDQLKTQHNKDLKIEEPCAGATYKGTYVGRAEQHVIVDTGRELRAFRAESKNLQPGTEVRVKAQEVTIENSKDRSFAWRVDEVERDISRGKARA